MDASVGTMTTDGVTLTSNQQTSEQMQEAAPVEAPVTPEVAASPEKKANPRKDLAARVDQLSAEVANKDQSISTLNQRLAQIDKLEAEIATLKAPKAERTAPVAPQIDWAGFTEKEPTIEQFADASDPYAAHLRATARYDARKDAYEARQHAQIADRSTQAQRAFETRADAFASKLGEIQKANPEFSPKIERLLEERGNPVMPPPVFEVLTESAVGPQLFEYLLEHPDEHQVILNAPSPKAMYRAMVKLEAKVEAAGSTGSALPSRPTTQAHPPINPVRGSHTAPTDGPPGDDATYEEHEKYWNRKDKEARQVGGRT